LIGFFITLPSSLKLVSTELLVFKALNLITITVPPALPAAMSIGIVFALARLRKNQIYCIVPQRINVAGRIKTIVFDKTGTLTEDSLKFSGVTIAKNESFSDLEVDVMKYQTSLSSKSINENECKIITKLLE
jgi:cation-transporting P-type ATPase 13A2